MRAPKRGESFMSMNGSPIAMGGPTGTKMAMGRSSIITVPLDGGKVRQLEWRAASRVGIGGITRAALPASLSFSVPQRHLWS